MTDRFNPPDQETVEGRAYAVFKGDHGKISRVAGLAGLHRSQLSRYLNPECPDKSPLFLTMMLLEACRYTDLTDGQHSFDELADALLDFIHSRRVRQTPSAEFQSRDLTEAINLYLERAPYKDQLRVVRRALAALSERETFLMMNDLEEGERLPERPLARAT